MSDADFEIVCSKIEEEKEFLNSISQEIWKRPELQYKEVHAHAVLTSALSKNGFVVQKHYFLTTAFRAEYASKSAGEATIAVLLEYDALPEIGHACGHNLIAEAGLAAALGIKAAMENDPTLTGKLVVLGTPAEEGGGGKIRLLELGAFEGIDAAMMVHPTKHTSAFPPMLCITRCFIEFKGKEAHASAFPWEGRNALDAAVACYNSISMLRQQMKPACRIHAIIKKGGTASNVIPAETEMEMSVRAPTMGELRRLQERVQSCIESAGAATGCEATFRFDESNRYENLISNRELGNLFTHYGERLGMNFQSVVKGDIPMGSTDMGNVSHVIPSIHPFFSITQEATNHTKGFTDAAGVPSAQPITLSASKAMAMTAIHIMKNATVRARMKRAFVKDLEDDARA